MIASAQKKILYSIQHKKNKQNSNRRRIYSSYQYVGIEKVSLDMS
jgi:hypothetical protein